MSHILLIETATKVCSVGLLRNNQIIAMREDKSMQYSHSSLLTSFIQEAVKEAGIDFHQLDAVAVSKGPGSYTGLRIGVSVAKGICYALDVPLIAINTLQAMTVTAILKDKNHARYYVPMIDARRMEVYSAVYDAKLRELKETSADIIDENSFSSFLDKGKTAFFGDGASKCSDVIKHENAMFFDDIFPGVRGLAKSAMEKYTNKQFEDLAYFEPFYLKDFVAGKPKVKGLM
jgi:tRNA threonylcarbamoyladenosine biosynthesis protein TsaB